MSWYWPRLTDLKESEEAAHQGAGACFFVASVTAIVAGVSVSLNKPVLGMSAWAFVDAGIFAIAGWRIWRLSRIWAVLALVLYIIEMVYVVESSPHVSSGAAFLRALLALAIFGSVRGTFAYHCSKRRNRWLLWQRVQIANSALITYTPLGVETDPESQVPC